MIEDTGLLQGDKCLHRAPGTATPTTSKHNEEQDVLVVILDLRL